MTKEEQIRQALVDLVASLQELIANSDGVAGLHLNGDIADWESLTEGGRFEGWLLALDKAERLLNTMETLSND